DIIETDGHDVVTTLAVVMPGNAGLTCRLGLQPLRRVEGGDDDVLVTGTAAEIAGNGDAHLLLGRIWIVAQELDQRRQHAGRAEAALQAVVLVKRLLERMQLLSRGRDALDSEKVVAVRLHRKHQT